MGDKHETRFLTLMTYEVAVRSTYVQGMPSADKVSASCRPSTPGRESTIMTRKDPRLVCCAVTRMLSTKEDLQRTKATPLTLNPSKNVLQMQWGAWTVAHRVAQNPVLLGKLLPARVMSNIFTCLLPVPTFLCRVVEKNKTRHTSRT